MLNSTFAGLSIPTIGGLASASASLYALHVNTQFLDHFKSKDTSQFIKGVCNSLKNLLKYFTSTAILMSSNSSSPSYNLPTKSVL